MTTWARWAALAVLVAATAPLLGAVGVPSPALFAGLLVGLVHALSTGTVLQPARPVFTAAQGVVGVVLGCLVQPASLAGLADAWLPVGLVTLGTLLLTVLAGVALARSTELDRATAAFGMIAGGASGIIVLADELGADARTVAVLQYLRILAIALLIPLAVTLFPVGAGGAVPEAGAAEPVPGVLVVLLLALLGHRLGRLVGVPAPALLGPLLLTAPLALLSVPSTEGVPAGLEALAYAVVGAQVGLRFTADSLRLVRRVLPVVVALVLGLVVTSAGLGLLLSWATDLSPLDGYLATTPGGLYVVLAVAADSGADSTAVLSVQVLRLLVMLLAAPPLARWLVRGQGPAGPG